MPAQLASRHVALLALLKMAPRWLSAVLLRCAPLHWLSPIFRMAATNHSEAVARLTANRDLRALLGYLFYGRWMSRRGGGYRGGRWAVVIGRAPLRQEEGCVVIGPGSAAAGGVCVTMGGLCRDRRGLYRDREGHVVTGGGCIVTGGAMS